MSVSMRATAQIPTDQQAVESGSKPVSWLFQKRFKGMLLPFIVVDREQITSYAAPRSASERVLMIWRVILHELFHYLLHWRGILGPQQRESGSAPDVPAAPVAAGGWSTAEQEEQAWLAAHIFVGLAVGAFAHASRSSGRFDSAWRYP